MTHENAAVNGTGGLTPQEIADTPRERIRVGDLRAGDRLPTQAVLAEVFVEQSQKWFDALWETIAADLTLSW